MRTNQRCGSSSRENLRNTLLTGEVISGLLHAKLDSNLMDNLFNQVKTDTK